ncbi:hypothetical protein Tco_0740240 [Tanacetum coccineum]
MTESGNNKGTHDENMGQTPISSIVDPKLGTSYDKLFTKERSRKSVNFRTLITPAGNGADVTVMLESIRAISERFVNMAYGFFLGKRVAYLVVANYVRNTWGKYGLVKSMLNSSTRKRIFKKRNKKKAKHKQIQAREGKDQVESKSIVIRLKKIQLEGLKLPSLKLYYKRLKRQGSKLPTK